MPCRYWGYDFALEEDEDSDDILQTPVGVTTLPLTRDIGAQPPCSFPPPHPSCSFWHGIQSCYLSILHECNRSYVQDLVAGSCQDSNSTTDSQVVRKCVKICSNQVWRRSDVWCTYAGTPLPAFELDERRFEYDMTELLGKGWLFYEAQRSGKLPGDNKIPFRGDSYLKDGSEHDPPLDLEGGWHDAGDTLKITFPLCATVCPRST